MLVEGAAPRDERHAAYMADAYARLHSGKRVGVFAMQHGPGAENAFGGVAQAYSESVPVLVLPAGYARRSMHVQPNYSSFLNLQHVTKLSDVLMAGAHTTEVMRRAFSALRTGRPRPVSVEVPVDVFGEEVADDLEDRSSVVTELEGSADLPGQARARRGRRDLPAARIPQRS